MSAAATSTAQSMPLVGARLATPQETVDPAPPSDQPSTLARMVSAILKASVADVFGNSTANSSPP